jgi:uncharacterized protein (DUF697 family)
MAKEQNSTTVSAEVVDSQPIESSNPDATNLINRYAAYSFGAGLIPFPVVDMVSLAALQVIMLKKIHQLYTPGASFTDDLARKSVSTLIATVAPSSVARGTLGSLVKSVPVIGGFIGALTFPAFAAASTKALGQVFNAHYASGGTIVSFNPKKYAGQFSQAFASAKSK